LAVTLAGSFGHDSVVDQLKPRAFVAVFFSIMVPIKGEIDPVFKNAEIIGAIAKSIAAFAG
jgi:hypothetical protein